ncbi:cation diffusion facilitator family transporter [Thiopseudomonas alkaliphila]|uniref:cation diffusion facilitator family transporter n=1 Tax=Thiopseudomonas alkaliphila TaxID=1697053 RepID=UPI002574D74B|nr:cation diffusion facilitator family transporter [Thiopseudomonas alkaliphila]MDM1715812.1 cation transporter [Thiopseudomonas alkaliphila]
MNKELIQARQKAMRNTSLVGALVNATLTFGKIIFGFIGHSHALLADGLHSLADLSTDLMVWFAAKYSNQPADQEHPYGHGRIETAFTVLLGVVLMVTAAGIMWDAGKRLLEPETLLIPTQIVLWVAALSIAANEWLYHYTMRAAKQTKSSLLAANAWHHRSDAISSIVVFIGVGGSLLGFPYLDAFAALAVAVMIVKIGWDQTWSAVRELIDTGLEPQKIKAIKRVIKQVEGVKSMHMLRSRRMAGTSLIDVHIEVDSHLSVSEGHHIGDYVRMRLMEEHESIGDVMIHIDPEDDALSDLCTDLPLRHHVLEQLAISWQGVIAPAVLGRATLHYLSGQIEVDLLLPLPEVIEPQLAEQLRQKAPTALKLRTVRISYQAH